MLGLAHERMGNLRTAIEFHEKHRDLVTKSGVELPAESGRHLIGAYKALAEELQRQGDYSGAIGYYERSLTAATTLGDFAGEGLAYQQVSASGRVKLGWCAITWGYMYRFTCAST